MNYDLNLAQDLILCSANNNGPQYNAAVARLAGFFRDGTYDTAKAVGMLERNLVQSTAKQLHKDYHSDVANWQDVFPMNLRLYAAQTLEESIVSEFELGNFPHSLPD